MPGCGGLTFSAWTSAEKIKERWEYLHSPMHAAGYALDPEFMMNTKEWGEAVTEGTLKIIERMCDGCGCELRDTEGEVSESCIHTFTLFTVPWEAE